MKGVHLTADLSGCRSEAPLMLDADALRTLCVSAVADAGLGAVAELFYRFTPTPGCEQCGVTGVVLLAESHLAVHTWPELGAVTLDVYVCNRGQDNSAKGERLLQRLIDAFAPASLSRQSLQRGS